VKVIKYPFLECPDCGATYFSIGTGEVRNGVPMYTCPKCKRKLEENEFKEVKKRLVEFLCEKCLSYVPDVSDYRCNIDKDLLCSHCNRIVAYGPTPIHVSEVRKISCEMLNEGQAIGASLYLVKARKRTERARLRYLNDLAQQEEKHFLSISKDSKGYLIFSKKKLLGYLSWNRNEDKTPVIRQLYVVQEMRRKGLGSILVKHFVDEECSNRRDKYPLFLVESPNEAAVELLTKLGYDGKIRVVQSI
jgi:GNAT superfamily N-acetyltransferase/uncharacterized protein YbaR (Trm112 family)